MNSPTPFVSPLAALFRSRKFVLTFVGVVLDLIIVLLPVELAPRIAAMREELVTAVTVLIGVAVGGIAVEDAAQKQTGTLPMPPKPANEQGLPPARYTRPQG